MRWIGGAHYLPDRFTALGDRAIAFIRPVWIALFVATLIFDITGTIFVWRDYFVRDPIFARLMLVHAVEQDGSVTVESFASSPNMTHLPPGSRLLVINGTSIPRDARVWDVARQIDIGSGKLALITAALPGGGRVEYRVRASDEYAREATGNIALPREVRIAFRLVLSVLTCIILMSCAALLFLRRTSDPVAMLFSFSFLMFAGSVDPPMALWMGIGLGVALGIYSAFAWVLLVLGLAAFPDGRFVPRAARWAIPLAVVGGVLLSLDSVPLVAQIVIAFIAPLVLVACQWFRFRQYETGIERQQIKWASFGFASGLIMLSAAFLLLPFAPSEGSWVAYHAMILLLLMDAGFIAMTLGLLVSLTRFRLWEADRVISRSAISAGVTLLVAVIWTMSVDLVKAGVEMIFGESNLVVVTMAGAVLAAGIFAPTQALALRWAKQRFMKGHDRIERLIERLAVWRTVEQPGEIAMRSLAALAASTHASAAAILTDTSRGRTLLAARGLADPDALVAPEWSATADARFPVAITLEDDDGPIGLLVAGPRSDGNRYNADERQDFQAVAGPLAGALRAARKRHEESETMQRMLGSVEERLARLEGHGPSLSPT